MDIGIYDVQKCFDTMWAKEAINDIYELGFTNDKLPLVYLANQTAHIAIKSSTGISERRTISKVIMQGTVWAGMLCTGTMHYAKKGELIF